MFFSLYRATICDDGKHSDLETTPENQPKPAENGWWWWWLGIESRKSAENNAMMVVVVVVVVINGGGGFCDDAHKRYPVDRKK